MADSAKTRDFVEAYISVRGGTRFVDRRPEFSQDANHEELNTCCSSSELVKVHLKVFGPNHAEDVCKFMLLLRRANHSPQPAQILSCSLDKSIIKWDFADGILVKRYKMNAAIHAMYTTSVEDDAYLYAVCMKSKMSSLMRFILPHHDTEITAITPVITDVDPIENHSAISSRGQFAASVGRKKLTVCDTNNLTTTAHKLDIQQYNKELRLQFTCVACHPSEHCIATGINDGKIVLWYNFLKKKKVVTSVMHWHFVSLHDLAFTREGSYLLSGGSESVLVKWQWNTNHRDFLPRLKSPIVFISCSHDNTHYALCHKDNGVQIVTNSFRLVHVYQGLTQACLEVDTEFGIVAGLSQDPHSGALVTNGKQGHLQFYNIFDDKLKFNMDVVSQNFPSPENLMHPHTITRIECVAFDSTGDWLATVERWDDGQMTPEIRLKFWIYIPEKQNYKLNTLVDTPHKQKVHVVKFRPSSHYSEQQSVAMAITASSDASFKTWCLVDDTDIYRKNQCWACESVGFFREQIPGSLDISEDGTLLAVAFDSCITLWDPDTNELKATLTPHHCVKQIIHLVFGLESCSHFIVGATSESLYVWNVLSLTVLVYSPRSSFPLWARSKPVSKSEVKAAIFITTPSSFRSHNHGDKRDLLPWQHVAELFYINANHEVLTLDTQKMEPVTPSTAVLTQNQPQTPFSLILSGKMNKSRTKNESCITEDGRRESATRFLKEILSTPAHVLPPVSSLAMNLMSTLLLPNNSSNCDDEDDNFQDDVKCHQNGIKTEDDLTDSDDDNSTDDEHIKESDKLVKDLENEMTFVEERRKDYKKFTGKTDASQMFNWLS
ncbi:hypothetical protein LSH36_372g00017 [Paralvinella palmiformis]|uniref:WD repeat-containing protein 75 second beta-propeller domain-containing protein n=1 Tax=Paralvinella palmiformis TaxID=53620 RepID=A0AAD9N1W5_9ANNE|nr:hypothetical protein LSH36_372g00017 [Paralvinella palmiformis]